MLTATGGVFNDFTLPYNHPPFPDAVICWFKCRKGILNSFRAFFDRHGGCRTAHKNFPDLSKEIFVRMENKIKK
jgi:hypothetical protein